MVKKSNIAAEKSVLILYSGSEAVGGERVVG
jgi:hypothetical protein